MSGSVSLMPRIEMSHDRDTGSWSVVTADQRHVFRTSGAPPQCDAWWYWLRQQDPAEADQFRGDEARRDFMQSVDAIRSGCYCDGCRGQIKLVAAETGEVVGHVSSEGRVRMVKRPLTYKQARTKYMDADGDVDAAEALEAMVGCVTMLVPDLDTIGRDWEPAKPVAVPSLEERYQRIVEARRWRSAFRRQPFGFGLAVGACGIGLCGTLLNLGPAIQGVAFGGLLAAIALLAWPRQRART